MIRYMTLILLSDGTTKVRVFSTDYGRRRWIAKMEKKYQVEKVTNLGKFEYGIF